MIDLVINKKKHPEYIFSFTQIKLMPYENDKPVITVEYKGEPKVMKPEEISTMRLIKKKQIAENYLGKTVDSSVLPSHRISTTVKYIPQLFESYFHCLSIF